MNEYLSLIRRSDFIDLFKYGSLYIDINYLISFDGDLHRASLNDKLRGQIVKRVNQFDFSSIYLLVHIKSDYIKEKGLLHIQEVQNIFALDEDARREISISVDPKIKIGRQLFPGFYGQLQQDFLFNDAKRGIKNLDIILGLNHKLTDYSDILPDSDIRELARQIQSEERPSGAKSFWIYLLRYERHAFFPKSAIGFFMDLINIYINTLKGEELDSENINNTRIYHLLSQYMVKSIKLRKLFNELGKNEDGRNFYNKLDQIAKHSFAAQIALLFLVFKSKFSEGSPLPDRKTLDYGRDNFPDAYYCALYLLGVYLGHSHTYDAYYDAIHLPIFHSVARKMPDSGSPGKSGKGVKAYGLFEDSGSTANGPAHSLNQDVTEYSSPDSEREGAQALPLMLPHRSAPHSPNLINCLDVFRLPVCLTLNRKRFLWRLIQEGRDSIFIAYTFDSILSGSRISMEQLVNYIGHSKRTIKEYLVLLSLPDHILRIERRSSRLNFDELLKLAKSKMSSSKKIDKYEGLCAKNKAPLKPFNS